MAKQVKVNVPIVYLWLGESILYNKNTFWIETQIVNDFEEVA